MGRGRFDAFDQLLDGGAVAEVQEPVRIRHAEIDFVLRLQFAAKNFLAVDERAVTAAHVFEH